MLIGVFIRHFKVFKGVNFIPFLQNDIENFKLFIGDNGVGKSSVLESLNTFFNDKDWILSIGEKKSEAYISTVFLVEKTGFLKSNKYIEEISRALWEVEEKDNANHKNFSNFFSFRNGLKKYRDTHFLICLSVDPNKNIDFSPFSSIVINKIKEKHEEHNKSKIAEQIRSKVISKYSYIYIPAEVSIDNFLRLEKRSMQSLLGKDVKERIKKVLNGQIEFERDGRPKKGSILNLLNQDLEKFVSETESIIKKIDNSYDFKKDYKSKTNLTDNHLRDIIVEVFFQKRKLKKGGKPIENLSSGERRKALVDVAYSFLTQDDKTNRKIILAIDEPESSLHISKVYKHFRKIEDLANNFGHEIFVATHWYGSLPVVKKGVLSSFNVSDKGEVSISNFKFDNYFENRGVHPDDIQMKSFFDLSSAIVSSLRHGENNWLIVEGTEDKNYVEPHMSDKIIILPVGGSSIVKKVFDYLFLPIEQVSEEKEIKGKVFCLIDSDENVAISTLCGKSETKNKKLIIRRLQLMDSNIELVDLENAHKNPPTEIEECLNGKNFYETLEDLIKENGNDDENKAFQSFDLNPEFKNSFIKGDDSLLSYKGSGSPKNLKDGKDILLNFVEKNKRLISERYTKKSKDVTLPWMQEINDFFK